PLGLVSAASAQSLSTTFTGTINGPTGAALYFDVTVGPNAISLDSLDLNTALTPTIAGATFGCTIYTCPTTYVGNTTNAGAWTAATTGIGISGGASVPSHVVLNAPFSLNASTSYGMAVVLAASGQTSAAPVYLIVTSTQTYSN